MQLITKKLTDTERDRLNDRLLPYCADGKCPDAAKIVTEVLGQDTIQQFTEVANGRLKAVIKLENLPQIGLLDILGTFRIPKHEPQIIMPTLIRDGILKASGQVHDDSEYKGILDRRPTTDRDVDYVGEHLHKDSGGHNAHTIFVTQNAEHALHVFLNLDDGRKGLSEEEQGRLMFKRIYDAGYSFRTKPLPLSSFTPEFPSDEEANQSITLNIADSDKKVVGKFIRAAEPVVTDTQPGQMIFFHKSTMHQVTRGKDLDIILRTKGYSGLRLAHAVLTRSEKSGPAL